MKSSAVQRLSPHANPDPNVPTADASDDLPLSRGCEAPSRATRRARAVSQAGSVPRAAARRSMTAIVGRVARFDSRRLIEDAWTLDPIASSFCVKRRASRRRRTASPSSMLICRALSPASVPACWYARPYGTELIDSQRVVPGDAALAVSRLARAIVSALIPRPDSRQSAYASIGS
jgi:hypothetical protein